MSRVSDLEYKVATEELALIDELVETGILGEELCPSATHLHWTVIKPESLPGWLRDNYLTYGEVRWYRND